MTKRKDHLSSAIFALLAAITHIDRELKRPSWPSEDGRKRARDLTNLAAYREVISKIADRLENYANDHDNDPLSDR